MNARILQRSALVLGVLLACTPRAGAIALKSKYEARKLGYKTDEKSKLNKQAPAGDVGAVAPDGAPVPLGALSPVTPSAPDQVPEPMKVPGMQAPEAPPIKNPTSGALISPEAIAALQRVGLVDAAGYLTDRGRARGFVQATPVPQPTGGDLVPEPMKTPALQGPALAPVPTSQRVPALQPGAETLTATTRPDSGNGPGVAVPAKVVVYRAVRASLEHSEVASLGDDRGFHLVVIGFKEPSAPGRP